MIPFNAKQNTPHHSGYKIFVLNILYVLYTSYPSTSH